MCKGVWELWELREIYMIEEDILSSKLLFSSFFCDSHIIPILDDNSQKKVFASGQAIREASLTVLRPTVHGSETSRTQKRSLCGFAASSGVLNPQGNKDKHPRTAFN